MDFVSLEGKEIDTYNFFNMLTEHLGWKYDKKESDLFDRLSKTFWDEGIKVFLVLNGYHCIPPQEYGFIKNIVFFKFDKKKHTEKNVYTHFQEINKNKQYFKFESVEEYIAHLEKNYPYIIPHSDFNTKDFNLLQRIDMVEVSNTILESIWDDLCLCEI